MYLAITLFIKKESEKETMKRKDVFQSPTLKAEDFSVGDEFVGRIEKVELKTFENERGIQKRACLKLHNDNYLLGLSQSNWDFLEDALKSDDSDGWIGAWIKVKIHKVNYMGKQVNSFHIIGAAFPKPGGRTTPTPTPSPQPPPQIVAESQPEELTDDFCPF